MKSVLALLAAFVLAGCATQIGVDNSQNREASFSNVTGVLTTRYTSDTEAVFNAVKRTIDAMPRHPPHRRDRRPRRQQGAEQRHRLRPHHR